jgi:hypothetical protein
MTPIPIMTHTCALSSIRWSKRNAPMKHTPKIMAEIYIAGPFGGLGKSPKILQRKQ